MREAPRTRIRWPARWVLVAIVVFAALVPSVIATFLLLRYADSQREREEQTLQESASGIARSIDAEFTTALTALNILKTSALLQGSDLEPFRKRLRDTTIETGRGFALIDASGTELINTVQRPRSPLSPDETSRLMEALKEQSSYISDVVNDVGTGEALAYVGLPIQRAGALQWILVTFLYGQDFEDLLRQPGVPKTWVVSIVDRHGTHVRRSHLNGRFAGRPVVPELIRHMANGSTGVLATNSLEDIPLITTVAHAWKSKWAVALGLPQETFDAPLMKSLYLLILSGTLLTIAALVFVFILVRGLDHGFQALSATMRILGRREVVDARPSSIREFDDLATTVAQVSHEIAGHNAILERRVSERTAELVAEMQRREASEAQVRQLQKIEAIGNLTGGIAHDFNNMLAVIISSLDLMQRRLEGGDSNIQKFVDSARRGADAAATLTRRLLAFSRQQALRPEHVDCNDQINGISELLLRTLPENVEIETMLQDELWHVSIDVSGLENTLVNLALNARDAMPGGGNLTIETGNLALDDVYAAGYSDVAAGDYVLIAITDTGCGMTDEVMEKVFEPFFTTKGVGHGTGLGLSQAHGFIKQSGGHITIYSELEHGTTIKIYLPRCVEEITAREIRSLRQSEPQLATGGERILVVEDEASVRDAAVAMLEELGYSVLEAGSGEEALSLLETHADVTILFTDVVMPGMNGRQLADEATKRWPHLVVLFASGYTRNAIVSNGTLDFDVHLLSKPYTFEMLVQKLAELRHEPDATSDIV